MRVDYAASTGDDLAGTLALLAECAEEGAQPIRVLLLERDLSTEFGWWRKLSGIL